MDPRQFDDASGDDPSIAALRASTTYQNSFLPAQQPAPAAPTGQPYGMVPPLTSYLAAATKQLMAAEQAQRQYLYQQLAVLNQSQNAAQTTPRSPNLEQASNSSRLATPGVTLEQTTNNNTIASRKAEDDTVFPSRKRPKSKVVRKEPIEKEKKTWVVTENDCIEGPVACACRYVRLELVTGDWPSPFFADSLHRDHMKLVAGSLEDYAYQVLLPAVRCSELETKKEEATSLPKLFFAILLGLREVITQNSARIFGKNCLDEAVQGNKTRNARIVTEEKQYCAKSLATGVVVAAIQRSILNGTKKEKYQTVEKFLEHAQGYDTGDSEFSSHLKEDRGNIRGVLPDGERLHADEEVARNVAFNRARKRHPMIQRDAERKMGVKPKRLVHIPEATACHISMVEQL